MACCMGPPGPCVIEGGAEAEEAAAAAAARLRPALHKPVLQEHQLHKLDAPQT